MSTQHTLPAITHEYRAHLKAREAHAAAALEHGAAATVQAVHTHLAPLLRDYAAAQAEVRASQDDAEATVPLSWLYSNGRLDRLSRIVTFQVSHFAELVRLTVTQLLHDAVQMGRDAASRMMRQVTAHQAVSLPTPEVFTGLVSAAKSTLPPLLAAMPASASASVQAALVRGVAAGSAASRIAGDVTQALGVPRYQALTLARTAPVQVFRAVTVAAYQQNADVVIGWYWYAHLHGRPYPCAACVMMHGTRHPLSEEMRSHPCCLCLALPYTASWPGIQTGIDWFERQPAEVQREILGGKYDAWKRGAFRLQDIVGSSVYGIYEKSLRELVA